MNRRTVIAAFVTDVGIDHLLDLHRDLLSGTMVALAGRKSARGHAPGPLRVHRPAQDLRRGGRLIDCRPTAPPEAPHRHCLLVAATLPLIPATFVTVTIVTPPPDMIPQTVGVMMGAVSIVGIH